MSFAGPFGTRVPSALLVDTRYLCLTCVLSQRLPKCFGIFNKHNTPTTFAVVTTQRCTGSTSLAAMATWPHTCCWQAHRCAMIGESVLGQLINAMDRSVEELGSDPQCGADHDGRSCGACGRARRSARRPRPRQAGLDFCAVSPLRIKNTPILLRAREPRHTPAVVHHVDSRDSSHSVLWRWSDGRGHERARGNT